MEFLILSILFIMLFIFLYSCLEYRKEKKKYNGGVCPKCGARMTCEDPTDQQIRKYTCECGYATNVCWKRTDKDRDPIWISIDIYNMLHKKIMDELVNITGVPKQLKDNNNNKKEEDGKKRLFSRINSKWFTRKPNDIQSD